MGIAIAGQIPTGIAIAGTKPSGLAAQGQVIWREAQPWNLLNYSSQQNVTSLSLDTTGANLLIAVVTTSYALGNEGVITDNQSNAWMVGVRQGLSPGSSMHYCINPTISASHTISLSGTTSYPGMIFLAYKGPTSIAFDQASTGTSAGTATSLTLGSLTPLIANSLIITGITNNTAIGTVDSGFTVVVNNPSSTINANAVAYLVQEIPAPLAPTWSKSTSGYSAAATMMNFIPF